MTATEVDLNRRNIRERGIKKGDYGKRETENKVQIIKWESDEEANEGKGKSKG